MTIEFDAEGIDARFIASCFALAGLLAAGDTEDPVGQAIAIGDAMVEMIADV